MLYFNMDKDIDIEYYFNQLTKISILKLVLPEFLEEVETSLKFKDSKLDSIVDFIDLNVN